MSRARVRRRLFRATRYNVKCERVGASRSAHMADLFWRMTSGPYPGCWLPQR